MTEDSFELDGRSLKDLSEKRGVVQDSCRKHWAKCEWSDENMGFLSNLKGWIMLIYSKITESILVLSHFPKVEKIGILERNLAFICLGVLSCILRLSSSVQARSVIPLLYSSASSSR